ncbi:MAG: hypothetical protein Q4B28_06545 [bacterium]|nr:hypothetical protein [bacterium]
MRLVQEGNAKALGTPWTDEEWKILEAIQDEERKQVVEELREGTYKPKKTEKSDKTKATPEASKKNSQKELKKTEKSE